MLSKRYSLIPSIIIGSIFGCGFGGVVEAILRTLKAGYDKWTLPAMALGYYSFLGIFAGIGFVIIFVVLLTFASGDFKRKDSFCICASAGFVLTTIQILQYSVFKAFNLHHIPYISLIVRSILGLGLFWLSYYIFSKIYNLFISKIKRPLSAFIIIYILSFGLAMLLAVSSPENQILYKTFDSEYANRVKQKPNIIFLLIDTLRQDRSSPYGYDIKTPNMQKLADDGIMFKNAIANGYWTMPTVSSIFTSLLPNSHGVFSALSKLPEDLAVLPDELSNAGYYSAGLVANPFIQHRTGFTRGFNEFHELPGVNPFPKDHTAPNLYYLNKVNYVLYKLFPNLRAKERDYCDAKDLTDLSIEWIKKERDKRFFLYLHYMDPHMSYYRHPYNGEFARPFHDPREENFEYYSSLYEGEIEYCDRHLGRLIEYLETSGLYDSCLIILSADHGEEFFDHYFWGHLKSMFDELIHVPLIIKRPFSENAGTINTSLVNQIDIAPTILSLVDLEPSAKWDGKNIFDPSYYNQCAISQEGRLLSIRTLDLKWIEAPPHIPAERIKQRYLILPDPRAEYPTKILFNLTDDPDEMNNLYSNPEYSALMDSLLNLGETTLSNLTGERQQHEVIELDEETKQKLKELGYLQ
ncbi:MAG: sulfatase-like hydrolase/transferase [candidate division Zixibacteria bacterium]|nr:sulfatase-like hydrolase/transferase [candidate division Zixibacteria bacterium]